MTWQPGRGKIAELLETAEVQQVTADHRIALLLDDAARHLATAAAALSSGDLSGAYQLAYDALRKSPRRSGGRRERTERHRASPAAAQSQPENPAPRGPL